MFRYLYHIIAFLLLAIAAFILFSSSLVLPDLIYPQRIDSLYVQFQKEQFLKEHPNNEATADSLFIFNPADIGLKYQPFDVKTTDGLTLKGWYIPADDSDAVSLLVLHDWNESKIMKLNFAKQMHDRGFHIYLVDLRSHGNSGGQVFSPAVTSVNDVKNIMDGILNRNSTRPLVLMGSGISSCIAIQSAVIDGRFDAIVLQCPVVSFTKFLKAYSEKKWGIFNHVFYSILKRKEEDIIKHPMDQLDMTMFVDSITLPTLLIGVDDDPFYSPFDCYTLYEKLGSEKKDLFLVDKATHENIEIAGGDQYYNRIAEFINNAVPKKQVRVKSKKLVLYR